MELECHAIFPLRIRHFEQINLRHSAGNVEQGIDSSKTVKRAFDEGFDSRRLAQVKYTNQRFGAGRHDCGCGLLQLASFLAVSTTAKKSRASRKAVACPIP
jgi:hypothetical protein